jgi:hypothetical protein
MHKISLKELDFYEAMELARTDPDAFEQYRKYIIESLIARAPKRSREHLRRLQWRIDMERERASNPVAACVKLYEMMWESFAGESGLVDTINNPHPSPDNIHGPQAEAKVVPFKKAVAAEDTSET